MVISKLLSLVCVSFILCGTAISAEPGGPEKLQTELKEISDAKFRGKLEDYKAFAEKKGTDLIEKADQLLALDGLTPENKRSALLWKYWGLVCRYGTDSQVFEKEQDQFVDSIENIPEITDFYKDLKKTICQNEDNPFHHVKNAGDPKIIEAFQRWVEKYLPFFEKYYSEEDQPQFIGGTICTADFLDPDGSAGLVLWTAEKLAPIAEKQKQSKDLMTKWRAEEVENSVRRVQMPGKEMVLEGVALDGSVVDVKDLQGKVVFLQFATTDQPGRIPDLIKLHNLLKDHGFVFLDHNTRDDRNIAQKKAEELGLPWTILCERAAYEQKLEDYDKLYACRSNAFLVGRDGKVIGVWSDGICPTLWKELEKQFPEQAEEITKLAAEQEENERKRMDEVYAKWKSIGIDLEGNLEKSKNENLEKLFSLLGKMNTVKRFTPGKDQQILELVDLMLSSSELSSSNRISLQIDRANLLESLARDAVGENPDTNPAVSYKEMEKCVDELLSDSNVDEIYNNNLVLKKTGILHQLQKYLKHVITKNDPTEKAAVAKEIQDRYVKILEKETQHTNAYGGGNLSFFSRFYIDELDNLNEIEILEPFLSAIIPIFEKAKDLELHEYAKKLQGIQRRISSVGKELEFECVLMDGKPFNVKDLRGKIVLVNIWATWCGPCVREFPNMQKQYEKYKDQGYEMIAYSIDAELDDINKFQEEKKYPWLVGSQKLSEAQGMKDYFTFYGSSGVPTTFLLDREGKVIFRLLGSDDDQLNAALEKAFANTENKKP